MKSYFVNNFYMNENFCSICIESPILQITLHCTLVNSYYTLCVP